MTTRLKKLNELGWFIPPYVSIGYLNDLVSEAEVKGNNFTQHDLEGWLARIYSAQDLAAMLVDRYPIVPVVQDYKLIIAESIQAHFAKLDHIAVSGLIPVIEGIGRRLLHVRTGKSDLRIKPTFIQLVHDCKNEALEKNLGNTTEVCAMLDSFEIFVRTNLYSRSERTSHADRTNRNGIVHGTYSDLDYGLPINFYKAIACVDFLCFISSFRASISWYAPSPSEKSKQLERILDLSNSLSISTLSKNILIEQQTVKDG